MIKTIYSIILILGVMFFSGCIDTGNNLPISQIGNNLYTVSYADRGLAYKNASKYCQKQNKVLKTIRERNNQNRTYTTTIIDFACFKPNSKEYQKNNNEYEATDISIKADIKIENN